MKPQTLKSLNSVPTKKVDATLILPVKAPLLIKCACCGVNHVDVLDGYLTCPDCIGKF